MKKLFKIIIGSICILSMFCIVGFAMLIRTNGIDANTGIGLLIFSFGAFSITLIITLAGGDF